MATVRFAHPFAVVAAAFHNSRNHAPTQPRAATTGFQSFPPGSANPTTPNLRQPLAADHGQPATSLQHARPPAPRTSQVFAGDQPTPAPAADPFSLADPATAGAILATSGFTAVKITGVHEPVYYGPDAASALRGMLSLQMTKALLAPLDAASTRHALSQLRAALANHHSSGGVFFDSYAWLITARRPDTLTPQRASSTRTPPPCRPAGQPARQPHDRWIDGGNIPHPVRPKVARWPATARAGIHLPSIGCADDLATAVKHDGQGSNS